MLRNSAFQTPGLVPLKSCRNFVLFRSLNASGTPIRKRIGQKAFLGHTFPKQIESRLGVCRGHLAGGTNSAARCLPGHEALPSGGPFFCSRLSWACVFSERWPLCFDQSDEQVVVVAFVFFFACAVCPARRAALLLAFFPLEQRLDPLLCSRVVKKKIELNERVL